MTTQRATAAENRINATLETIDSRADLRESATAVLNLLKVEDEGWESLFGADETDGLDLEELKERSEEIREAMVKSPVMDRGAQLRHSYVWSKGINLPDLKPEAYGTRNGPKSKDDRLYEAYLNPVNQRYVFSATAQEEMERALYSDGNFFLLGDNKTRLLRRVPLTEITGFVHNPDFKEEIWAWQRTWMRVKNDGTKVQQKRWYYTDDCPLPSTERASAIGDVPVDQESTILAHSVNRMVGWPLGIPDAIAVLAWAKLYSDFLKHGYVMSRALASIAFKAVASTQEGAKRSAAKAAAPAGAGRTSIVGQADGLQAMPTAGRGYDFSSGRPLAAMIATGVQVSIVHLLSDPGAAGSSYGSASNLDLPTKRAVVARQRSWISFFERVLSWLGANDPKITFPSLEEPDFYRMLQSLVLGWNTGNIRPKEMRLKLLELLDIITDDTTEVEGVLIPNNALSLQQTQKAMGTDDGQDTSSTSPNQGRSNGAGDADDDGDLRSGDNQGENLATWERRELTERIGELLDVLRDRE